MNAPERVADLGVRQPKIVLDRHDRLADADAIEIEHERQRAEKTQHAIAGRSASAASGSRRTCRADSRPESRRRHDDHRRICDVPENRRSTLAVIRDTASSTSTRAGPADRADRKDAAAARAFRNGPGRRRRRRDSVPWPAAGRSPASWARSCRSRGPRRRRESARAGSAGRTGRRSSRPVPAKAQWSASTTR